jgi:glycosyltransferase involved in cell wall biosynthesis
MENLPKVSVIVPLFNKRQFISEALDSVLNQTFSDFELIVVDDCSTDGSQDVVKAFKDPRIRFYQNEKNIGTAGIANKLIDLSRGEYIVRMDADDIAPEYRIQVQVDFMNNHPEIGASSGWMQTFGKESVLWSIPETHEELKARMLFKTPLFQPAAIFRSSVLTEKSLRYDCQSPNIAEDWLFFYRLSKETKMANLPLVLNHYRVGDENLTIRHKNTFYEARYFLYSRVFDDLGLPIDKIDVHFLTKPYIVPGKKMENKMVAEFYYWLQYLKNYNQKTEKFTELYFEKEIQARWDRFFFMVADIDLTCLYEYWKLQKKLNLNQLLYALKVSFGKWFRK